MHNIHSLNVLSACPALDRGLVDNTMLALPEMAILPSENIDGLTSQSLQIKRRSRKQMFHKICEGVCPDTTEYETKTVTAKPFMRKIQVCREHETLTKDDYGVGPLMVRERAAVTVDALEQLTSQFYGGLTWNKKGGQGLADLAAVKLDACACGVNGVKDFGTEDDPFPEGTKFTSLFFIRAASSAADDRGLRHMFGGGRGVEFDSPFPTDIIDVQKSKKTGENCTVPGIVQYMHGAWALKAKCEWDVVEVCNVPIGCVSGFYLDMLINNVAAIFPFQNKPTHVLIDKQAAASWVNARRLEGNDVCCLKRNEGPLGNSIQYMDNLPGAGALDIVISECIPRYEEKLDCEKNPIPHYICLKQEARDQIFGKVAATKEK